MTTTTSDDQRQVSEYKEVMLSAFAVFTGLEENELRVGLGGARELLRSGGPVLPEQIARTVDLPTPQVKQILRRQADLGWVFFDGEDRVMAMWAIGGPESGHDFEVAGKAMPTWCALDTLLIPNWLDVTARVTSRDPLTQQSISFTVSSEGVADLRPAAAVVSAYEPAGKITREVRMSFCRYVNFFESVDAGERWATTQGGRRFRFLPIDVAFTWAKDYTRSIFEEFPALLPSTLNARGSEDA